MRLPGILLTLLTSVCLAGCTSSTTVADLAPVAPRPSKEVTSSLSSTAPSPQAIVSLAKEQAVEFGDTAGLDEKELPVDTQTTAAISPDAKMSDDPEVQTMAMVAPDQPKVAKTFGKIIVSERKFRDAKPINFGKASPRKLAVHGVDVSRWQGNIDWERLRSQGANFAYIKATDGGDHLDPMFKTNWRGAHAAGLKRGAYHFFYWCRTASEQADWFIRNVPRVAGALPPVIDVEYNGESRCKRRLSRATILEKMQVFMDKLEAHYGQRPIIYTAPDFYADNLRGEFLDYPFWLRSVAAHPSKRYGDRKWVFWQYSGSGLSHGVRGKIDLNVFHGTERQWRSWLGESGMIASAD